LIENDKPQEIAIIVGVQSQKQELSVDEYLDELEQLVYTSGARSIKRFTQKLEHPHAKTYVGKGKMQEIAEYCKVNNVDIAISFGSETIESLVQKDNLVHISASAQKLTPGAIANLALRIAETGGNVERIHRSASSPSTTIEFFVSGATSESLRNATNSSAINSDLKLVIQENI